MKHLIPLLLALLPATASAQQDPGFFKPPADDSSITILRDVFGAIVDTVMGSGAGDVAQDTALSAGMAVFCSGVLALGMLFVIYSTIKAAIDTAHDGEFLGKRISSVWMPLRTFGGTAILLPLKSGFCIVQILILWIAVHGVGLSDRIWSAMITHMETGGLVGRPSIPDSRPLAASILRSEVCMAALNKSFQERGDATRVALTPAQTTVTNTGSVAQLGPLGMAETGLSMINMRLTTVTYTWGTASGGYMNPNVCGSLTWQQSHEASEGNANLLVDSQGVVNAQISAVNQMITRMRALATQIVAGQKPSPGELESAAEAYERAMAQAAQRIVQEANSKRNTAFLSYAESGGWLFAGTYYNHVIAMNDAVQRVLNAAPQPSEASILGKETDEFLIGYKDALIVANEYIRNGSMAASRYYQSNGGNDVRRGGEMPVVDADESLGSWDAIKERVFNQPTQFAIRQISEEIGGSNTSHVTQMKNVGDVVMGTGWALLGAASIANGFAGGIADDVLTVGTFDAHAALEPAMGVTTLLFTALLAGGAYLAFYLPMIPYIAWVSGVIKWLIVVIESVIAGPIWAAAHIHPDGDDQVGRAGPGYMIILSVFLRPALMLFGLIIAIVATQPIAHFINMSYMSQVQGSMGSSLNGLGALIAYTLIYALVMTILLHSMFAIINWLPDSVLRFIGNAVGAHGIADHEGKEVEGKFMGVISTASHGVKPRLGGGGQRGGSQGMAPALDGGSGGSGGALPPPGGMSRNLGQDQLATTDGPSMGGAGGSSNAGGPMGGGMSGPGGVGGLASGRGAGQGSAGSQDRHSTSGPGLGGASSAAAGGPGSSAPGGSTGAAGAGAARTSDSVSGGPGSSTSTAPQTGSPATPSVGRNSAMDKFSNDDP